MHQYEFPRKMGAMFQPSAKLQLPQEKWHLFNSGRSARRDNLSQRQGNSVTRCSGEEADWRLGGEQIASNKLSPEGLDVKYQEREKNEHPTSD
jgi:DNA repair photolyase